MCLLRISITNVSLAYKYIRILLILVNYVRESLYRGYIVYRRYNVNNVLIH